MFNKDRCFKKFSMFDKDQCFNCNSTDNIMIREFDWLQTDRIKDGGGRRWEILELSLCDRCYSFAEKRFRGKYLEGWDEMDAVDGLEFEEDIYDFIYFDVQLFDNKNIKANSQEAKNLGKENISKICSWYNQNKNYGNDQQIQDLDLDSYPSIIYEHTNDGMMIAKVDKILDYPTLNSIINIDQDGNYLLNGYYVHGSFHSQS